MPSRTYRITYDDSWFDSAEKQKLCAHEFSYYKSQERDFVLILFAADQYTKTQIIQDAPRKTHIMLVNKNIAPSKLSMEVDEKRGCLPGHSQALTFWCPWIILGVPWASPSLGSSTPCSIIHQKNSPKTWKLHNTKLNRKSHELR